MAASLHLLVCQYYIRETEVILSGEGFEGVTVSAYPDLCVHPKADCTRLVESLFADSGGGDRTVILIGACYLLSKQIALLKEDRNHRICHENLCFYMLIGQSLVDHYLHSGSHLVTAGWLSHWREHINLWQFDQETARAFFAEGARRLTLLDTGVDPEASHKLEECANYLNLPYESVPVGLDHFRLVLARLVLDWRIEVAQRQTQVVFDQTNQKLADYVLVMDLFVKLSKIMAEDDAIRAILDFCAMLFGANYVAYVPADGEHGDLIFSIPPYPEDRQRIEIWTRLLKDDEAYAETPSGFCVRVRYQNETLGMLIADSISLPQRKQDYLNLALNIVNLCGLVITNAKSISRRQRAEDELARSNADLEQFAFVASHDLQAPLRRIVGFGELLSAPSASSMDDSARQYLDIMIQSSRRMQQLISGLLTYARVNTRGTPFGMVSLPSVVRQALDDLTLRLQETKGTVDVMNLPSVTGDEMQLYQLFQNLISNALKFVPAGQAPHIVISSQPKDKSMVEISIRDNGIGFDEKDLEKIFLPFKRLHREDVYPGSGIGLAVCQKIVQRHGGTITAHSKPGEGSTFVFTLPEHSISGSDLTLPGPAQPSSMP
jgi:signal transduction histidine kinase